jgi:hypothetical protein
VKPPAVVTVGAPVVVAVATVSAVRIITTPSDPLPPFALAP